MDFIYNGEKRLSISFSSLRNRDANIGNYLKKGSFSEQRERKHANTWDGAGRACGRKSLQKHFYAIFFVYITNCFHPVLIFMRF